MTISFFCVMCGRWMPDELTYNGLDPKTAIFKHLDKNKWIVQENGEHMDIYCSGGCAA